jgi:hypothetical protein
MSMLNYKPKKIEHWHGFNIGVVRRISCPEKNVQCLIPQFFGCKTEKIEKFNALQVQESSSKKHDNLVVCADDHAMKFCNANTSDKESAIKCLNAQCTKHLKYTPLAVPRNTTNVKNYLNIDYISHDVILFNKYFGYMTTSNIGIQKNNQTILLIENGIQFFLSIPTRIGKFNFAFFTFSLGGTFAHQAHLYVYSTLLVIQFLLANLNLIPSLFIASAPDISFQPKGKNWKIGIKMYYTAACQKTCALKMYWMKCQSDIEETKIE